MAKSQPKASTSGMPAETRLRLPLPGYFQSLSLQNVRCFGSEQTLRLINGQNKPAQWTIILGENGTGKTTLLQALACFELKPVPLPEVDAKVGWQSRLITFLPRDEKGCITTLDSPGFRRNSQANPEARCRAEFAIVPDLNTIISQRHLFPCTWAIRTDGLDTPHSLLQTPFIGYGVGRRLGHPSLTHGSDADSVGTLFDEYALLRNAEEWLLLLDYTASKESEVQAQQKTRLEQIKQLLIAILPDVEDIRFIAGAGPYPKPRVEFKTFSGWVPLRRLGYGYQTLIAWVTDFASRMVERYPDSTDPFKEAAIVLVDEIDLHLHPLWQRKLIADLTKHFPNTQFIATAHSPLVVQAAEHANIAVLKRVGDHVEIVNDPEQIRGWRIDQILTSDLFGLKSARSPDVEALFERKKSLLDKARRNKKDEAELREIQAKIDKLPVGDSAHVAKEMEAIREALALLKDHQHK
jgi:energy-coupling factor transporter ATP-binding protein EcfA2